MENIPFKVSCNNNLGRHLVTTRPVQSGEVILQETPLVRGPFLHTVPVCLGCNKILSEKSSQSCTKCGWPVCSEVCEKSELHAPECTFQAQKGHKMYIKHFGIEHPNYQFITILRCLHLKEHNPQVWDKLMNLQTSGVNVGANNNNIPADFVLTFFKLQEKFSREEVEQLFGIISVNGHEIPLTQPPQIGVYEKTSFLEHNCQANCTKTFTDDGQVLIIATEDIPEDCHLSISYTDPLWGVKNRRFHLNQSKQFWCYCRRCKDPTEFDTNINSLRCPNKSCDGFLTPNSFLIEDEADWDDDWNCNKCDESLTKEAVEVVLGKIGENLAQMPKGIPKYCKDFVKKYESVLAPNHFYMLDVKVALVQLLGSQNVQVLTDSDLRLCLKLSESLRGVVEKIAPAELRLKGALLFYQAKALMQMDRRNNLEEEDGEVLVLSEELLTQACQCLKNEPNLLQEGKMYRQIKHELQQLQDMSKNTVIKQWQEIKK